MTFFENVRGFLNPNRLEEAIDAFKTKEDNLSDKALLKRSGEGIEFLPIAGFGISSFNQFYRRNINRLYTNEVAKIKNYRTIAQMPEIADVIENAVVESCQKDVEDEFISFKITNEKIKDNRNIVKRLEEEFREFFNNGIKLEKHIETLLRIYLIDGRVYYERLIDENNKSKGIQGIKILPTETMDFDYNYRTGRIERFYQYLKPVIQRPADIMTAVSRNEAIQFNPEQIGYVEYGIYGKTKHDVLGYLEKVKIPYNQLKLLETSLVIYRLIRSPERFVFKIDVGNMPKDKAVKYVEKIKEQMIKKQSYDPQTGRILNEPNVWSLLENFFIAQGSDGRGSSVETVGGGMSAGFTELNDIYYFQKKLYQALKYPMSRVNASQTGRDAETLFMRSPIGEISRDEVIWAIFLERQQKKFCEEFEKLFLLHLDFKGLKKEFNITVDDINIELTQPSFFRDRQQQLIVQTQFDNYNTLANREEMSKCYLMQRYLKWTEEEIKENADGIKKDIQLGFRFPPMDQEGQPIGNFGPKGQTPTKSKPPEEEEEDLDKKKNKNV